MKTLSRLALSLLLTLSPFAGASDLPSPGVEKGQFAAWSQLGRDTIPQANRDAEPWEKGLEAQQGEAGALFRKAGGSGFAVRTGLYSASAKYDGPLSGKLMAGTITPEEVGQIKQEDFKNLSLYEVASEKPLPGLKQLVLSVRVLGLPSNEHFTPFLLIEKAFPASLYLNGGAKPLEASARVRLSNELVNGFPQEVTALQWDLSKVEEPITSYRVEWRVYPHASLSGVRVDEGESFAPLSAPTPKAEEKSTPAKD